MSGKRGEEVREELREGFSTVRNWREGFSTVRNGGKGPSLREQKSIKLCGNSVEPGGLQTVKLFQLTRNWGIGG